MAKFEAKWWIFEVFSANLSFEFQKEAKFTTKIAILDMQNSQRCSMVTKIEANLMKLHNVSFKMVYSLTSADFGKIQYFKKCLMQIEGFGRFLFTVSELARSTLNSQQQKSNKNI